ncbi:hypothetical protein VTJ83DRAFT_1340 [Remersonia thermophila]|uniref:Uncharacterized protein n=1 Tax=Remersonia thermophila TaxID=72144 RepID=A0ABR4DPF0_9PEZI
MATKLQIHAPYVLQALPRPLDGPDGLGRYQVGEVFGQKHDGKRRKRTELAVAIDGVAVYLYDILSSQAVTSYLVSPQSVFTCAPYSLRWRPASSETAVRFTYVSLSTGAGPSSAKREIKLFKEETTRAGTTTATTVSQAVSVSAPIVHVFATSSRSAVAVSAAGASSNHDLIAVAADGALLCLDGETLREKWQSSPSVLSKEILSGPKPSLRVDFVQPTQAADVIDGLFNGKNELFGIFQEKIHRDHFNPDFAVLITSDAASGARHLHLLALPSERESRQTNNERVVSVFAAPLAADAACSRYQLDVRSGTLQTLSNGAVATYAFSNGLPRLENKLQPPGISSFVRLSRTSILISAADGFAIYNPVYRSLQATTSVDAAAAAAGASDGRFEFVTYLASREIAVGLCGANLTAVQIEAPRNRTTKRRAEGLLTDAIRRGIPRDPLSQRHAQGQHADSAILAVPAAGDSEASLLEWQSKSEQADEFLRAHDLQSWERIMSDVFKVPIKPAEDKADEEEPAANGDAPPAHPPEWLWPSSRSEYARVDRRWVFYAISKIFSWGPQGPEPEAPRLACRYPESNVLNYLVDVGHLTTSNIKSAFREEAREADAVEDVIGEELPVLLARVDPTMELLVGYISATQLGPTELVSSIKLLLDSLGLFEESPRLLAMRPADGAEAKDDPPSDPVKTELDRAEEELHITEHYLVGHRTRGLGVAFGKLAACPSLATVKSLRRLFKAEEIIGLMNVLRAELIKDGWTTRYLDRTGADQDEAEAPPDGSIELIANLMSRCIDAVGLSGWMASDALLSSRSGGGGGGGSAGSGSASSSASQEGSATDFFSQFQAEISVALEGIMEAVRLQAALAEAVGYARRARKALPPDPAAAAAKGKPTTLVHLPKELPIGLKTDARISAERIRSGGEVVQRSTRQMGHFVGKKRGVYSVLRLSEESMLGGARKSVVQETR